MKARLFAGGCVFSLALIAHTAFGQMPEALNATGTELVEVAPETMGMHMKVEAIAADLDASIADMQGRIESIRKALEGIEPKPTIKVGDPVLQGQGAEDMERMTQRMQGRFGAKEKEEMPKEKPVKLNSEITATWKLPAADGVAQMRTAYAIEKTVREALPKMEQEKKEMTEEEEEMMLMYQNDQQQIQPGQPVFFFTATLSSEARKEGISKALADAKENAAELAGLSSIKLGSIKNVSIAIQPASGDDDYNMYSMRRFYGAVVPSGGDEINSTSPVLKKAPFQIMVSLSYEILQAGQ